MARTTKAREGRCEWVEDDQGTWETACGHAYEFTDGGPHENQQRYCGYCGKPLKVRSYSE